MTTRKTYPNHEPEALMPAPGWRAVYVLPPAEGGPGWFAEPLVALAVCHVTHLPCTGSTARGSDDGRQVHGYINDEWIQCAEETDNFWRYLAPGDPDPTPDEVHEAQALRKLSRRPSANTQTPADEEAAAQTPA